MDYFQGDVALEGFVQRKVNGAQPAAAELFHNSKVAAALVDEWVVFFRICRFFGTDGRMAGQEVTLGDQDGFIGVCFVENGGVVVVAASWAGRSLSETHFNQFAANTTVDGVHRR